nr:hypothetical protein [Tanacetum cinerariifolium]
MIFDGMLRNLDNVSSRFLMYSRFIQTFLDKQLDGLPTHKEKYDVLFHTKKVFANMKRIGKGFSGKETPLFPTMMRLSIRRGDNLVRATTTASSLEAKQDSGNTDKTQTKATSNEPSSQGTSSGDGPRFLMYSRFIQTFLDKQLDGLPTHKKKYDVLFHTKKVFANMKRIGKGFSGKETPLFPTMVGPNQIQIEVSAARHNLMLLEDELKRTKTAQQTKIDGLERRVKKLEKKHMLRTRLYKVGLTARIDEDISLVSTHDDVVQDEGIEDVGEEEVVEVVTTAKMLIDTVVDVAQVTTAPTITVESTKINVEPRDLKKKSFAEIQELFDKSVKRTNNFVDFRIELVEDSVKKDKKMEDDKESAELKQCLKIIPDDGDDVTIDATPLSSKSPTIVDYKIYK